MNRRRRPDTARLAVSALAFLGIAFVGWGLWIPAKAWAAQVLIARTWDEMCGGGTELRPWPGADIWPIARLQLPGGGRMLYVLAGASGQSLAFGPAHVAASARPGEADNVVFAGHRDTHFAALEDLDLGDEIVVEALDGVTRYRVETMAIVHESRVDLLERTGRAELTLITCFPFDAIVPGGPMRFVVHAVAIDAGPGDPPRSNRPADARR